MSIFNRFQENTARWLKMLNGIRYRGQTGSRSLADLPPEGSQRLDDQLEALPLPAPLLDGTVEAIDGAIAPWLESPHERPNALAIVGNSVEAIAPIVETSVAQRQQETVSVRSLDWGERPLEFRTLENRLVAQLGRGLSVGDNIILIPNLSWCFLRSADGLGGIEYLRRAIASERDRFWVVGCGKLAWCYLNSIAKISAYLPKPYFLPQLNGEQLQAWLAPIVEDFGIRFNEERHLPPQDRKKLENRQIRYYEELAKLSLGSIAVARELFARSQRTSEPKIQPPDEPPFPFADDPKLPDLPALSPDAQYLLYSILLHDRIDLAHLAESLGDSETNVQSLLQNLRKTAIVQQSGNVLRVNPLHYPRLRDLLDSNYFLMSDD